MALLKAEARRLEFEAEMEIAERRREADLAQAFRVGEPPRGKEEGGGHWWVVDFIWEKSHTSDPSFGSLGVNVNPDPTPLRGGGAQKEA